MRTASAVRAHGFGKTIAGDSAAARSGAHRTARDGTAQ